MINNISLDSLKIFYLVAKEGNFTRVAERLFISQSAVTQTIKKLEKMIGFSLFNRSTKGVDLTSYGQEIFNRLTPVFSGLESVNDYLERINNFNVGEIKICCGTNLAKKILLDKIINFNNCHPDVKISQFDYPFEKAVDMLQSAKIDIFVSQNDDNLMNFCNFLPIFTEKYVFVCSKEYYKNDYQKNNVHNFIVQNSGAKSRKIFDEYMLKNNIAYNEKIEVVGYNMMIDLCKNNMGIIMIPSYLVESELRLGELVDFNYDNLPNVEYGVYTNKYVANKTVDNFLSEFV